MDLFEHQIVNFIFSIATGLLIGILFDIYRGLWKRYSPPRVTMPFLDTIWWMIVTILVFLAFLWCTWGEVRFYLFLGQVIGFFFYRKKISSSFLKAFLGFLFWGEIFLKKLFWILLMPFKILKKIIFWPFALTSLCIYKIICLFIKILKFIYFILFRLPVKIVRKIIKFFKKNSRKKK